MSPTIKVSHRDLCDRELPNKAAVSSGLREEKNPYLLLINGGRFRGDTCGLTQKEEWCGSIWRVPLYSLCTVWLIYWTRSLSQNDLLVPLSQVNSCFDAPSITSLYVGLLQTVLLQSLMLWGRWYLIADLYLVGFMNLLPVNQGRGFPADLGSLVCIPL